MGFYQICNESSMPKAKQYRNYFIEVYEIVMDWVMQSRVRNITRIVDVNNSVPIIEQRIDKRVNDRVSQYKSCKLNDKLLETTKMLDDVTNKNSILEEEKKQSDHSIIFLNKKYSEMEIVLYETIEKHKILIQEHEEAIKILISKNEKLKNNQPIPVPVIQPIPVPVIQPSQLPVHEINPPFSDQENIKDCLKDIMITRLKDMCKKIGKFKGYTTYKKAQKDKLELLILTKITKDKNTREMVIKYLKANHYI
jgi:dsDNA-binding SOS-regulon protein